MFPVSLINRGDLTASSQMASTVPSVWLHARYVEYSVLRKRQGRRVGKKKDGIIESTEVHYNNTVQYTQYSTVQLQYHLTGYLCFL